MKELRKGYKHEQRFPCSKDREVNALSVEVPPSDAAVLAVCLEDRLDGNRSWSCQVARSHYKMGKFIIEFDAAAEDGAKIIQRQFIGKIYIGDRGQGNFDALNNLWESGFHPPSPFTVVFPIAYIPDRHLLLQEKAPGRMLSEIIFGERDFADDAIAAAAGWLAALHDSPVGAQSRLEQMRELVDRYGRTLAELLPEWAGRIERLTDCVLLALEARHLSALVPSHGDFHSKNVFIAEGRVTAIDLDTFGRREQVADVAYFLAQTAIMGYRRLGSFEATVRARHHFLRAYLDIASSLSIERLAIYLGATFLQSLYYELSILRTGNTAIVEPWLANAERCLLDGEVLFGSYEQFD